MYGITWIETDCESCKRKNWLRLGNLDDMTVSDSSHWSCFACKQTFPLSDDPDAEIEDVITGLEKP